MKSVIKFVCVSTLILGGTIVGATVYANHSNSELASIIDQLNPLVSNDYIYVKTISPDSVNEYGIASYTQKGVTDEGSVRQVTFNGMQELKTDRYLKLSVKGKHVKTYEEVSKEDVPVAALKGLENI